MSKLLSKCQQGCVENFCKSFFSFIGLILTGFYVTFAENESGYENCFLIVSIIFLEKKIIFDIKPNLQIFVVFWPNYLSDFLHKIFRMFVETAFYVSRRIIWGWTFLYLFVLKICSVSEHLFYCFCPKNLDIFIKSAFQVSWWTNVFEKIAFIYLFLDFWRNSFGRFVMMAFCLTAWKVCGIDFFIKFFKF